MSEEKTKPCPVCYNCGDFRSAIGILLVIMEDDEKGTGKKKCSRCDGSGSLRNGKLCYPCNGSGEVDCHRCHGTGRVYVSTKRATW